MVVLIVFRVLIVSFYFNPFVTSTVLFACKKQSTYCERDRSCAYGSCTTTTKTIIIIKVHGYKGKEYKTNFVFSFYNGEEKKSYDSF